MKKFFVTILKYLALIIGVLSCLMSFIVLPVTLVFLPLGIFLIFMGLKPVEYLDGTIAKRKKEEKELAEKEQKEELNRMIRQLEKEDLSKRAALIDGVNLKSNEFCYYTPKQRVKWQEQKTRTVRTNYSGLSSNIRIAKGLNYRMGSIKHNSNKVTEWKDVFIGVPFLTNKRIIFVNENGMKVINLSNIVGIKAFSNGTHLYRESGKIILLRDFDATEFNVILNRILNKDFEAH